MAIYKLAYSTYEKEGCMVISDGAMEINTSSAYLTEQAVKAIFSGLDVIIRYTN